MAYTTKYTANIDYPSHYYRAYMEYQVTTNATNVKIDFKYGIALHSGYSSSSHDNYTDRYVAVSVGTASTGANSYNKYNMSYVKDSTALSGSGSNWWHQTGTTSTTINRTHADQTLYLVVWGKTDTSGSEKTASVSITVPRLPRVTVNIHANGGTIADSPHEYTDSSGTTHYYKLTSSKVYTSGTASGTYSIANQYVYTDATYYNLTDVGTYNITKAGYHITGTSAYGTTTSGGTIFSQSNSSSSSTNAVTSKRLNGGTEITEDTTVVLYANWIANTYTVNYNANGGSGTTASSSHTYGTAKALTSNGFSKTGYSFYGWATTQAKADAGTRDYTNGQSVSNLTTTNNGTFTLYAVWTPYTMTFKFHANGGTIEDAPHEASSSRYYKLSSNIVQYSDTATGTFSEYHQAITTEDTYKDLLNITTFNITKSGCHVVDNATYNTASDGSGIKVSAVNTSSDSTNAVTTKRINGGTQISSNVTKTLYVDWVPNTWIIHFDGNGATGGSMSDQVHTRGEILALPANQFTKTGYHFVGWQYTDTSSGDVHNYNDGYEMPANWAGVSDTGLTYTLVAQWKRYQWVQINNSWKGVDNLWVQIGGVWKPVSKLWVNIGNTWKEV